MKLSVAERMALLNQTLPTQGSYLVMTQVDDMRKRLNLTPEEIAALGPADENGEIKQPNLAAVVNKEVEFSDAECRIVSEALIAMDKKNVLSIAHIPLYEKFVREQKSGDKQ